MKSLLVLIAMTFSLSAFADNEFSQIFQNSFVRESTKESILSSEDKGNNLGYNRMFIENRCNQPIGVFLVYKKLSGQWDTSAGYYRLEPGQQKYVADTRNAIYYFAAASLTGPTVWKGTHNIKLDDGSVIGMFESQINSIEFTDWNTFFCN